MEQDIWQRYLPTGQVQVLGVDLYVPSTIALLGDFQTQTGATFPLLLNGSSSTGGNMSILYGTWDNYIVVNKQGIVRYHAALTWPHGNRYHLDEIQSCVDSLLSSPVGVEVGTRGLRLAAGPSPFRDRTGVELSHPGRAGEKVRVTVHDLSGRRVATLLDGAAGSVLTRLQWDGSSETGGRVPAGVYVVHAEIAGRHLSRRVVLLR